MVQLKARLLLLLLLLLLTEAPLALLLDTCDGHADLSQEPTGHLSFTAGRGTGRTGGASLAVCTRTLEIPARHTARLKLVWLESGSNVSLACVLGTRERSLDVGDTALLSGCDRNRATLTWTGAGHSSNAFQLFYYVQEETRSTTATSPVPRSHPDVPASNPASTIERGPFSTTERGPLSAGANPSGNATRDPGLVQTAPFIDGEASSFPGEARNNGPETSAATARTDSPGTPDYFNTRRSIPTISNDETSTSAGPYTTSRPSGYEERKGPSMSSVESSDSESTSSRQNPHATVENKVQDLTENSQSIGTPAAESARTQREELLEGSSSARSESSHSTGRLWGKDGSAIASTANPRTMTKSELQDVTHEVRQPGSGQDSTVNFDLLNSTQESAENTQSTRTTSVGASSASLVPHSDTERNERTSSSSTSSSEFRESGKATGRNDLLTRSDFGGHSASTEFKRFPTEATPTVSPGALAVSTPSPRTTSVRQISKSTKVLNDDILPKTESSTYAASAMSRETQSLRRVSVSTSPYQIPPSSPRPTTRKDETRRALTTRRSQQTPSTPEPVDRAVAFTRPHLSSAPVRSVTARSATVQSATVQPKPKFYIVPDEPPIITAASVEILLQITVDDSHPSPEVSEDDAARWLEPYLRRAPGFRRLLGAWSRGPVVQCLLEFDTGAALQWLPHTGASSLLDRTGLTQAALEGRSFRSARVTNVTLGGVPEVCGGLLRCPSGYTCAFHTRSSNFSCSSVCRSEHCGRHGLCTHHPGQQPLCRCIVGQDVWFMGSRCEVQMTRARLALSCLGVLLLLAGLVAVLVGLVVRRYRALLAQAKADQTRSSYRRFNHFDELSGRIWLRSGAGSADSLDNPAFTRSTEILHLRALERPCCYHDDSLSLPSTCPSPGTRIRTIYPHSSQYAWRGSDLSLADGVLDSGKASDLSVCSWPVEPIQWSPFPLLQQLSRQPAPVVRVSRPRSYCDGMELVDINKSWTA